MSSYEQSLRRPDFVGGQPLRLRGSSAGWWFPVPKVVVSTVQTNNGPLSWPCLTLGPGDLDADVRYSHFVHQLPTWGPIPANVTHDVRDIAFNAAAAMLGRNYLIDMTIAQRLLAPDRDPALSAALFEVAVAGPLRLLLDAISALPTGQPVARAG